LPLWLFSFPPPPPTSAVGGQFAGLPKLLRGVALPVLMEERDDASPWSPDPVALEERSR
jgi:hypothetical protein